MRAEATKKVLVTGAGGRTGALVFKQLLENKAFSAVGMVRSNKSADKLQKTTKSSADQVLIGDIADKASIEKALSGCDAMIIATSAVPKIKPLSIAKLFFLKLFGGLIGQKPGRPEFYWEPNGSPEQVDWIGQKNQIDAAKKMGVKHVVVISSMGGTQPENFLNTIGKKEDGTGGDILLWKRKAEKYLIDSGLAYTIVHPGGLIKRTSEGARQKVIMGINDELLKREKRSIPREDVAEVCVQSLLCKSALNRSVDIISEEGGDPTSSWDSLFASCKGNCNYEFMGDPK